MGLFSRRPLALFCALFLVTSLLMIHLEFTGKLWLALIVCTCIVVLFFTRALLGKARDVLLATVLCLVAVAVGTVNSAFRIDMRAKKAEEWVGERRIVADVVQVNYVSETSSVYVVDLEQMSDRETDVKALLILGFECDLRVGDRFVTTAEIMKMSDVAMGRSGYDRTNDKDVLLTAVVYEPRDSEIFRFYRELPITKKLFAENGFSVVTDEIKSILSARARAFVGEEYGGVVNGILLGDTSDVSTEVLRDFRRSGVSHLFAVSGLHISVLLGAAELLFRRLFFPKSIRCVAVSVLAVILLILTGFSMSALRSVLMLWIVYIAFSLSEEVDLPTSLFLSISVILLIFPYAVFELGMWMSFLATLGLVTLYTVIDSAVPRVKKGIAVFKILMRISRFVLMITVMTVLSNMFLLPIQWGIFGEISAVSVPTNILLAPLNGIMLILSVTCLALGGIPILGGVLCVSLRTVCSLTLHIVHLFSNLNSASISLKYPFVAPMVAVFCVTLLAVLTLNIKRKWLMSIPFVGFAAAFAIGVSVFNILTPRSLTYYGENTQEIISVTDGSELCIIDMSNGAYGRLDGVIEDAKAHGATDVDTIIFTDIQKRHLFAMDRLFRNRVVEKIYVPVFSEKAKLENAYKLCALADACGVESAIYKNGEVLSVGETNVLMLYEQNEEKLAVSAFVEGKHTLVGYTDADGNSNLSVIDNILYQCDTVLVGNNGVEQEKRQLNTSPDATVIYSSPHIKELVGNNSNKDKIFVSRYDRLRINFVFK